MPAHRPGPESSGNAETGTHLGTRSAVRIRAGARGQARGPSPRSGFALFPGSVFFRSTAGCQSRLALHAISHINLGGGGGEGGVGGGAGRALE